MTTLLALMSVAGMARCAEFSDRLTQYERGAVKRSVVRIEIEFRDSRRLPIGKALRGHGVAINQEGWILTAAHVIFPSVEEFRGRGAKDYRVIISEYDDTTRAQPLLRTSYISALDLPRVSLVALNQELAGCKDETDIRYTCLASKPEIRDDYAFLLAGPELRADGRSSLDNFLDLLGPEDNVYCTKALDPSADLAVVSDFALSGTFSIVPATIVDESGATPSFRITDGTRVKKGISGSPLILISNAPQRMIQVIGLVTQIDKTGADYSEELGSPSFNSTLTSMFMQKYTRPWSAAGLRQQIKIPASRWRCRGAEKPYPSTLLAEYLWAQDAQSEADKQRETIECIKGAPGWRYTTQALSSAIALNTRIMQTENPNIAEMKRTAVAVLNEQGQCSRGAASYINDFLGLLEAQRQ